MTVEKKQFCPNCGNSVISNDFSCSSCGFSLFDETQEKNNMKPRIETKPKFLLNVSANLSIIFTVIAALLYAFPIPPISLYGGVPFSVLAIITGIIGLTKPHLKTRKIVAIIIAFVAPAVWFTQFWFYGIGWF